MCNQPESACELCESSPFAVSRRALPAASLPTPPPPPPPPSLSYLLRARHARRAKHAAPQLLPSITSTREYRNRLCGASSYTHSRTRARKTPQHPLALDNCNSSDLPSGQAGSAADPRSHLASRARPPGALTRGQGTPSKPAPLPPGERKNQSDAARPPPLARLSRRARELGRCRRLGRRRWCIVVLSQRRRQRLWRLAHPPAHLDHLLLAQAKRERRRRRWGLLLLLWPPPPTRRRRLLVPARAALLCRRRRRRRLALPPRSHHRPSGHARLRRQLSRPLWRARRWRVGQQRPRAQERHRRLWPGVHRRRLRARRRPCSLLRRLLRRWHPRHGLPQRIPHGGGVPLVPRRVLLPRHAAQQLDHVLRLQARLRHCPWRPRHALRRQREATSRRRRWRYHRAQGLRGDLSYTEWAVWSRPTIGLQALPCRLVPAA